MSKADSSEAAIEFNLSLDREAFAELGEARVREQLQAFARSTKIDIDRNRLRMALCGTDLAHHAADPHLHNNARSLPAPVVDGEYAAFHARLSDYDLCMEDSWTGFFVARCLANQATAEPLVFIHLDDHTDMMDTLLTVTPEGLQDPGSCKPFNPGSPTDWSSAIRSGAVGIGSFVTALYYLPQSVHVMHINHLAKSRCQRHAVVRRAVTHPLLPHTRFATIEKGTQESADRLGTYTGGSNVGRVLRSVPEGRMIVHIDLDYFINDYNGNPGTEPMLSVDEMRKNASELMRPFFDELARTGATVERWIIATSPGFCSALHWRWLLDALSTHISRARQSLYPR